MTLIDFAPQTRIIHGPGTIEQLGALAAEFSVERALVVSDPGIVLAGHTRLGCDTLSAAGIETLVFSDLEENPTTRDVQNGLSVAQQFQPQLLVGLGGGSSMDCAKGINFVYSCGGQMKDYWGTGKATAEMLPMIAIPTTAGTGSETQSFALISDADSHIKMACGDKRASCRIAILDPQLTLTQPAQLTALTGIDAIAHALETSVTTRRNAISLVFSREAWRLLAGNFSLVLEDGNCLEARAAMQLGACLAGVAIENSMLGATHSLANPLTTSYGIVHGQAIAIMLPHVIRFNGKQCGDQYAELLSGTHALDDRLPKGNPDQLATFIEGLIDKAGLPRQLSSCGVEEERLEELASQASQQWTAQFNPRKVSVEDFKALYQAAF
ncbi:MAG: iron-containing alcohol dehydrogenase [Pirellulaceae bacterium]